MQESSTTQSKTTNANPMAFAGLSVIGGILVLVAVGVHWGTVTASQSIGGGSITVKGGGLAIGLGIALIVLGVLMATLRTRGSAVGVSIAEFVVGGITVAIALYFTLSKHPFIQAAARTLADRTGRSTGFIESRLNALADRGTISVSRGVGTYLALIGGILGFLGGLMGFGVARRMPAPAPRAPGMPFPGTSTDQPTGGPLGAAPPPPGEPGPTMPEAGGVGGGPVAPLPPEGPPKPGEPGSTPEAES